MSFLNLFGEGTSFTGTDGKEYNLKNLTLKDIAKFVRWVQYKPYNDAVDGGLPKSKCDEILAECQRGRTLELIKDDETGEEKHEEFPLSWTSTIVQEQIFTLEGFLRLVELSLLKSHPNVNLEDILDQPGLDKIQKAFLQSNAIIGDKEQEKN